MVYILSNMLLVSKYKKRIKEFCIAVKLMDLGGQVRTDDMKTALKTLNYHIRQCKIKLD